VLCALGFEKTLPYVHGSQGCVAYFRTYFNRHFKEPIACVSDSMTEDAAVFGGQKNMFDGLENAKALYKPDMIAVSTTCMAEVIGDDLNAFINNSKKEGHIPQDYPVPFAHTPSFVGSHVTGWDNMFEGIIRYFTLNHMEGKSVGSNGKINIVPGFETYLGNYKVIKRMLTEMGVDYSFLCDPTEVLDTPADGQFRMYAGGTTMDRGEGRPERQDHLPAATHATGKDQETGRNHLDPGSAQAQHPHGPGMDRRVAHEGVRSHRQAHPRLPGQGTRPPAGHDDGQPHLDARQEVCPVR
jgi:nitrogenase molybdenum-iron protein beta chain